MQAAAFNGGFGRAAMQCARSVLFTSPSTFGVLAPLALRYCNGQRLFSTTRKVVQNFGLDSEGTSETELPPSLGNARGFADTFDAEETPKQTSFFSFSNRPSVQPNSVIAGLPPSAPKSAYEKQTVRNPKLGFWDHNNNKQASIGLNRNLVGSESQQLDTTQFSLAVRNLMRRVPQNVAIVLAQDIPFTNAKNEQEKQNTHGMTVSSFNTVTLNPVPIVSFNIRLPSRTGTAIQNSKAFTVHLLNDNRVATNVARKFAGGDLSQKGLIPLDVQSMVFSESGKSPLLKIQDAVSFALQCQLLSTYEIADHIVVFGKVERLYCPGGEAGLKQAKESTLCYGNRSFRSAVTRLPEGSFATGASSMYPETAALWHFQAQDSINKVDFPEIPSPREIFPLRLPLSFIGTQIEEADLHIKKLEDELDRAIVAIDRELEAPSTPVMSTSTSTVPTISSVSENISQTRKLIDEIQSKLDNPDKMPLNLRSLDQEITETGRAIEHIESLIDVLDKTPASPVSPGIPPEMSSKAPTVLDKLEREVNNSAHEINLLELEINNFIGGSTPLPDMFRPTPATQSENPSSTTSLDKLEQLIDTNAKRIELIQQELDLLEVQGLDKDSSPSSTKQDE